MEIKQEYRDDEGLHVNFTYVGERRGVTFKGDFVTFVDAERQMKFFITEIEALLPYFEDWVKHRFDARREDT